MRHRLVLNTKRKPRLRPLAVDPTRTGAIRKAMAAELKRRFARIRLAIYDLLISEDAFGLEQDRPQFQLPWLERPNANTAPTANQRWRFLTSPDKLRAFRQWLREQFRSQLIGRTDEELWQAYINDGFRKGAGRAFADATKIERSQAGQDRAKLDFYEGTRQQFLRQSFGAVEAVEKAKLLAARSFDDLEGITEDVGLKMSRKLTDGLVQGKNPREIARDLNADLNIGKSRALTIARTELIRAHAEGQLQALSDLGVEEVGVMVEWATAKDDKVCPLCEELDGLVLPIAEAKGMLPRHPNCRCAWIPAGEPVTRDLSKFA